MMNQRTRNYTIDQKMDLMNKKFPNLKISRSTLHKI